MTTGSIISSFKEEESKRSPYFQSPRPLLSSTDTPKSSVFFSRSPSSVHGSVDSLGPLIYTWINTNNSKSDFVGGPSCTRTNEACTSCPALISQAKRQFSMCPIFQQRQQQGPSSPGEFVSAQSPRNDIKNPQQRRCCVELAGETMELNVRHLCEFGCYLRAFSPCRDWVALRKTLHTRTDQSLGTYSYVMINS